MTNLQKHLMDRARADVLAERISWDEFEQRIWDAMHWPWDGEVPEWILAECDSAGRPLWLPHHLPGGMMPAISLGRPYD